MCRPRLIPPILLAVVLILWGLSIVRPHIMFARGHALYSWDGRIRYWYPTFGERSDRGWEYGGFQIGIKQGWPEVMIPYWFPALLKLAEGVLATAKSKAGRGFRFRAETSLGRKLSEWVVLAFIPASLLAVVANPLGVSICRQYILTVNWGEIVSAIDRLDVLPLRRRQASASGLNGLGISMIPHEGGCTGVSM